MIRCNVTVTTAAGVVSYTGLYASTTRAAFDAIRQLGGKQGRVCAKRA